MMQPNDFRSRARTVRDAARKQLLKLREERMTHKVPRLGALANLPAPEAAEVEEDLPTENLLPESGHDAAEPEVLLTVESADPAEAEAAPPENNAAPETEESAPVPVEGRASAKPRAVKRKAPPKAVTRPAKAAPRKAQAEVPEDHSIRRAALAEMFDEAPSEVLPEPEVQAADPAQEFPLDDILAAGPLVAEVAETRPVTETFGAEEEAALPVETAEPPEPEPAATGDANPTAEDLHLLPGAGPGLIWMLRHCGITTLAELAACDVDDLTRKLGLVGQILDVSVWRDFALGKEKALQKAS